MSTAPATTHLTTHVLDASAGTPAVAVLAVLWAAGGEEIARAKTDTDGRAALGPERLPVGTYVLTFATGAYFARRDVETFYPEVAVTFAVADAPDGSLRHHHVPLLLSPFAYSTYRGS
ncbi:hydroxyisourate hydrolase [Serinibacter arcticus]|uniref:5-hydroxyisourate hydrolase n=1 Tax=Serinibacter arcticus TaxID=1655435 RepID=A0A4Z1E452_9MICO|nr:hydroxyisourate hydrolase [Serinibacter arcticus]TGO05552.1 5-Hydroxyisourate Hydrolase (HIUase) [Serinibacter arcticus]